MISITFKSETAGDGTLVHVDGVGELKNNEPSTFEDGSINDAVLALLFENEFFEVTTVKVATSTQASRRNGANNTPVVDDNTPVVDSEENK